MNKTKSRYILVVLIIFVTAGLVTFIQYDTYHQTENAIQTISKIPSNIGEWQGTDVFLSENVYELLETRAIIHRSYAFQNQRVFLSLVYYPETKVDFHAPEACLGGRGKKIRKTSKSIAFTSSEKKISLDLNQLVYDDGLHEELVYYFYKAGSFMGKSYIHLRLKLAANKLSGNGSAGALIRVSTSAKTTDSMIALERLKLFVQDLYPYLVKYI